MQHIKQQIVRFGFAVIAFVCVEFFCMAQTTFKIGVVKYDGGGDWYGNPKSLPNLAEFCNENLNTNIEVATVEVGSPDITNYAMLHLTGHGNVLFSPSDVVNLRQYLLAGGFLHIDDNYGLDNFIRREMKKVFPDADFIELPSNHEIYNQQYKFPNGLPKIHEHDGKPAQGFGIIIEGRLVCFYTHECDLGDGWESPETHNDSEEVHQKALQMGANIVRYVCTH